MENRRLGDALVRAEQAASENQARIAELEWRLRELEAETRRSTSRELRVVIDKLDALTAETRRLAHVVAPSSDADEAGRSASAPADGSPADGSDPKVMLRYWAERLRTSSTDHGGGLSPEQNSALDVILRSESWLDLKNPWPTF